MVVLNNPVSTFYVCNQTREIDLDNDGLNIALGSLESGVFRIISGTEIQLRAASLGGGSIVAGSLPLTPIMLSGAGSTIHIP